MEKLFTVYQPNFDKFVKDGNFVSREMADIHFKITTGDVTPSDISQLCRQHLSYDTVCTIIAKNLDEVFEIGNIGPEEKITRLNPMHSVSVGDIIEDSTTSKRYVVSPFGFKELK
jgi:hypothetical protein